MAQQLNGCICKLCDGAILSRGCSLQCANYATAFDEYEPCCGVFHLECWSADKRFASALPERKFRYFGLRLREADAEMLRDTFICELCVVRSQVGGEVAEGTPTFSELLVLERKRQLSICAAKADSTVAGHVTGIRKIRHFEDTFGVRVVPKPGMINLIQQWQVDGNDKMVWHYDSVDTSDTMAVLREI